MPDLVVIISNENLGKIEGRWSALERTVVNSMPDKFRWGKAAFLFDPTGGNIAFIKKHLPDALWDDPANLAAKRVAIEEARPVVVHPITDFQFKTKPMPHQELLFGWSRAMPHFAIFYDKGLGKTKSILDILADRYERGEIVGALVFAPNGVHRQWVVEQVPFHWVDRIPIRTRIHSSAKPVQSGEPILKKFDGFRLLTVNIEALSRGSALDRAAEFLRSGPMALVIDESSRIRNHQAQVTQSALELAPLGRVRIIASGSPTPTGLTNYFTQFRFLDPDILPYGSIHSFTRHFCILEPVWGGPRGATTIVGYRNMDELEKLIKPFSIHAKKSDIVNVPKLYENYYVETTAQQRKLYNQIRKDFVAEFDGKALTYPNALARMVRLQQVLSGQLVEKTQDKDIVHQIPTLRPKALEDILSDVTGKAVVWARFQTDIDQISDMLLKSGRIFVTYDGRTSPKDRADAITRFVSGDAQVFVGNAAAAGIGLNLQVAKTAIYYSNSTNPEHRDQSEDRTHRIGTTEPVLYIDMVVPESVDTIILKGLRDHIDTATMLMENGPQLLKDLVA